MEQQSQKVEKNGLAMHWPVALLALAVVIIFLISMMSFQVKETEYAVIKRSGKALEDASGKIISYNPGLHFKLPFVDQVWRHDKRIQCYELKKGEVEQVKTKDDCQIVVSTYVLWKISDEAVGVFMKQFESTGDAESKLDFIVRTVRSRVMPHYDFRSIVFVKEEAGGKSVLETIEDEMLKQVRQEAFKEYGIDVVRVGFRRFGFTQDNSQEVLKTMAADRKEISTALLTQGKKQADDVRVAAQTQAAQLRTEAEKKAKKLRSEGELEASKHMEIYRQNLELARFLRYLNGLEASLNERDTLILGTDTAPFHLLSPKALDIGSEKAPAPATK
ncbi:MAG: hypothetical protein J6X55_10310 [Victivallales bacterium]|nr:hypothetical protein [Victivallales bacterium]